MREHPEETAAILEDYMREANFPPAELEAFDQDLLKPQAPRYFPLRA